MSIVVSKIIKKDTEILVWDGSNWTTHVTWKNIEAEHVIGSLILLYTDPITNTRYQILEIKK